MKDAQAVKSAWTAEFDRLKAEIKILEEARAEVAYAYAKKWEPVQTENETLRAEVAKLKAERDALRKQLNKNCLERDALKMDLAEMHETMDDIIGELSQCAEVAKLKEAMSETPRTKDEAEQKAREICRCSQLPGCTTSSETDHNHACLFWKWPLVAAALRAERDAYHREKPAMSETILVQMVDRVWAEEPGVEVSAKYSDDGGTVRIQILKDGEPIATATLGAWRWGRLHKIEVR